MKPSSKLLPVGKIGIITHLKEADMHLHEIQGTRPYCLLHPLLRTHDTRLSLDPLRVRGKGGQGANAFRHGTVISEQTGQLFPEQLQFMA